MNTTNLPYLPTEIWDKIYDVKKAMEDKDRSRRHSVDLHNLSIGWTLTSAEEEEIETDREVANLKELKVSELKTILRENRLQLSGEKYVLMIKVLAFRWHGVKLKMQNVTKRQKFKDIWECLEHAPQKMYDAAVKCQWSTEPLEKMDVHRSLEWSGILRLRQRNKYYAERSFSRYYCGHQLHNLDSSTDPNAGWGGYKYNGDGWCGTK